MAKVRYRNHKFSTAQVRMLNEINTIIDEYQDQGFVMTVRQLYYQMVARDIIPNAYRAYKQLINTVTNGRMAGKIDWDMIEDSTREFSTRNHWNNPGDVLRASAQQFHMDMWADQDCRPFLIVEKDALKGVFQRVCFEYDVGLLAARGYPSVSCVRAFSERDIEDNNGQQTVLLHFGDHDPSGLDMSRDWVDRIREFVVSDDWNLSRMALNMDQIEEMQPPPNPAKQTDVRFKDYQQTYGTTSSWELDALPPTYLEKLARDAIESMIDWEKWNARKQQIDDGRARLLDLSNQFDEKEE